MAKIALVGRPNVGKSTLFNRLVGRRMAIVDDQPGVTRDRRYGDANLADLAFIVIDTAGFDDREPGDMAAAMRSQTEAALAEADCALMLIDSRAGITPLDRSFGQLLRRAGKPVALIANKCEGKAGEGGMHEAWELGLGQPVPISAEHNEGMSDLYDTLQRIIKEAGIDPLDDLDSFENSDTDGVDADVVDDLKRPIRLAIIGRPNVGKSTLLNQILGENRALVGPEPGVTRDSIAVDFEWQDRPVKLFDTAGMRRRARVTDRVEKKSVDDTLEAVRFADVTALIIDAEQCLERQDLTIAHHVIQEGRALVLGVNKWDAVEDRAAALQRVRDRIMTSLPDVKGISVTTLSALTGQRVDRLLSAATDAYDVWNKRVPTGALNRWLSEAMERHPPPIVSGRRIKVRYISQIKRRPPTFALFGADKNAMPETYVRYLSNELRETFDFPGTPIRFVLRRTDNPYAPQ